MWVLETILGSSVKAARVRVYVMGQGQGMLQRSHHAGDLKQEIWAGGGVCEMSPSRDMRDKDRTMESERTGPGDDVAMGTESLNASWG